jgi:hypothetical protein
MISLSQVEESINHHTCWTGRAVPVDDSLFIHPKLTTKLVGRLCDVIGFNNCCETSRILF